MRPRADVIPVAPPSFRGMCRDHTRLTCRAVEEAAQRSGGRRCAFRSEFGLALAEAVPRSFPGAGVHDGRLLARNDVAAKMHLSGIGLIVYNPANVSRPIEAVVLKCCVIETKVVPCCSSTCIMRAKSSSERLSRSTLYTMMQST